MREPPPKKALLKAKLKKIASRNPGNISGYAFTAGKRWALDQIRIRERLARQAVLDEQKRIEEERRARHEAAMRLELEGIIAAIEKEHPRYAFALRLAYFARIPAAEWGQFWPGSKRDLLYQIKCRARNHAAEMATPELREWIGRQSL